MKLREVWRIALDDDLNAAIGIPNMACQMILIGEAVDKRPEANSLNAADDCDMEPLHHIDSTL